MSLWSTGGGLPGSAGTQQREVRKTVAVFWMESGRPVNPATLQVSSWPGSCSEFLSETGETDNDCRVARRSLPDDTAH